jgi:hypothetical protein
MTSGYNSKEDRLLDHLPMMTAAKKYEDGGLFGQVIE